MATTVFNFPSTLDRLEAKIDALARTIAASQSQIYQQGVNIMATITDVQSAVASETTVVQGAVTLLNSLSQMLKDALASNDPAAIQAVIDQIDMNRQALADAVTANTPATP